jgi:hypothetical protein
MKIVVFRYDAEIDTPQFIWYDECPPDGAPQWRINNYSKTPCPPCLGEALRRESFVWGRFS